MKRGLEILVVLVCTYVIVTGCSSTSVEYGAKGAVGGAVSASFVSAMTDLIVDGRVDTYRMSRAAAAGAVVGGTAGAMAGQAQYEQQKEQEVQAEKEAARKSAQADTSVQALEAEIGKQNVQGIWELVQCNHEEAYRIGLSTARADEKQIMEAGIILQALVDRDRGNTDGMDRALQSFVEQSSEVDDVQTAKAELETLHGMLMDERKVHGLAPACQ